jgi:ABC-type Na+ efflux pump permease subunit
MLTVVQNNQASRYHFSPDTARIAFGEKRANIEVVRPGMAVDNITKSADGGTITAISLAAPKARLNATATRQFLLGIMLVELAIILLILTQAAASTATREKEDGTLDLLLSTPITSRYYIWGKLRGLVSFVLPLLAVPVGSMLLFVVRDILVAPEIGESRWFVLPESLFLIPGTLVMLTAFAAILGMQMSLRCRKTVMAVMSSVGIVGAVCGGLWFCGNGAAGNSSLDKLGLVIASFSPFTLMALMVNPGDFIAGVSGAQIADASDARALVFLAGWAAIAGYGMVVWTMYKSMVHNCDMTIRKQAT